MFVLVVLSLTLCLVALIYLLAHKHESFKEALSFTIVLLVSGGGTAPPRGLLRWVLAAAHGVVRCLCAPLARKLLASSHLCT